jgi:hypothetical protein
MPLRGTVGHGTFVHTGGRDTGLGEVRPLHAGRYFARVLRAANRKREGVGQVVQPRRGGRCIDTGRGRSPRHDS